MHGEDDGDGEKGEENVGEDVDGGVDDAQDGEDAEVDALGRGHGGLIPECSGGDAGEDDGEFASDVVEGEEDCHG